MLYDYFAAVNMLYVVLMPYCHREEPFRATPVPERVCAICLRALAIQNGMGKLLTANCHTLTGTGAPEGARNTLTGTGT